MVEVSLQLATMIKMMMRQMLFMKALINEWMNEENSEGMFNSYRMIHAVAKIAHHGNSGLKNFSDLQEKRKVRRKGN